MHPQQKFDFVQQFSKNLNNYQSKLWYQLLVSRSEMFKRLDKNQDKGELVLSNKINTLKFFQNFID